MANILRRNSPSREVSDSRRWDPFEMMREVMRWDPLRDLDTWPSPLGGTDVFSPRFDVKETRDGYLFRADLPGVKEEDVEISMTGSRLVVSGRREQERHEEGDRYFAAECSYGSFSRAFTLPDGCDAEHVSAELKDGVLRITVPKKPEVQPRRISVGRAEPTGKAKA